MALANGTIQKTAVGGSNTINSTFSNQYSIKDEWDYFSKFQFYLNAEALYRKQKWQAGFRAGIAATPLAKQDGPSRSVRLEVFYRLKLYDWKTKK